MMAIAFISDINFFEHPYGGAASNDARHCQYLQEKRGLNVDIITPQNYEHRIKKDYELLIFSNCVTFSHEQLKRLTEKFPYITFTHDYYFCNFRLHFSGKESCRNCPKVPFWKEMYKNSKKNIFLSPLHHEMHEIIFGSEVLGGKVVIPSAMDVNFWHPVEGIQRLPKTILSVNGLAPFKGRYNVHTYIQQHPDWKFTLAGIGVPFDDLAECAYIGHQTQEQLRELYSLHEYVLMLPDTAQPFEQVFIEAILCGAKVIGNKNVGATSYTWNFSDREEIKNYMRQAQAGFSDEVYEVLEGLRR